MDAILIGSHSNLRKYHNHWKSLPTSENFFYWLDYGEGKDVELPTCSRERLEWEQVRYLSREERLHYLVRIDADGRLCWAKNGERISTKEEAFRDSIEGIVPVDDSTPMFRSDKKIWESGESSATDDEEESEAERYVNEDFKNAKGSRKLAHVSPAVIFNHLIRTSMKRGNKWIFVIETHHIHVPGCMLMLPRDRLPVPSVSGNHDQ